MTTTVTHADILRVLQEARETLSVEERWTKGAFALDVNGDECQVSDPRACCWCLSGALNRVAPTLDDVREAAWHALYALIPGWVCGLASWNDSSTHAEVLELLDRAIAETEKEVAGV